MAKNLFRKSALSEYTCGALVSLSSAIDGLSKEKKNNVTIKGLCLSAKSRVPKLYFTIGLNQNMTHLYPIFMVI